MPTTRGEAKAPVPRREEVLSAMAGAAERVVGPRNSVLDTLLLVWASVALVAAGASAPDLWLMFGTAAGGLVLFAVRRAGR